MGLSVTGSQQDQSNSKENRLIARVRSHYTGHFGSSISDLPLPQQPDMCWKV